MAIKLDEHPTVIRFRERQSNGNVRPLTHELDATWLRQLVLDAGADDVGLVEIDRPEVADQRQEILDIFPATKTLVSFVVRMNREPVRSPVRSVANNEFHKAGDKTDEIARHIVTTLQDQGIRTVNPAMAFPMEMTRYPGKSWLVSHKPIAEAAGLGVMGLHRNVIHPEFGNFILLNTLLLDAEVSLSDQPISYNPCFECKLCVSACPVGAIEPDRAFNFASCYTHNYREFMGGFSDWVETIVASKDVKAYREKVGISETASWWQSLTSGANYKAAYCMSVCPAGDDVIGPFLTDRKGFLDEVVKPLQQKEETIYVVPNSDAELHVQKRFPHKTTKRVGNGIRPHTIQSFLSNLDVAFQKNQAEGVDATYHMTFTGSADAKATVMIKNQAVNVEYGHAGTADLQLTADSATWLKFLGKETNLVWALLRRKIRIKGDPRLMMAFGRCFPM